MEAVAEIILNAKSKIEADFLTRDAVTCEAKRAIEKLVYDYYEIAPWEAMLIRDTVEICKRPSRTAARGQQE